MNKMHTFLNVSTAILAAFTFVNFLMLTLSMAANAVRFDIIIIPITVLLLTVLPCLALVFFGNKVPKIAFVLQIIFVIGLAVYAVTFIIFSVYTLVGVNSTAVPEKCNGAIIFGAKVNGTSPSKALSERLTAALDIYGSNPNTVFILSGGQGSDEEISEAQCMENFLISHGVPKKNLIKEELSTDTVSNVQNSKRLLSQLGISDGIVCISSEYHIKRIEKICNDEGLNVTSYGAKTSSAIKLWTNLVREYMSGIKYYLEK